MLTIEQIQVAAVQVGLDDVGVARADVVTEDKAFMEQWIEERGIRTEERGLRKEEKLWYLGENREKRYDPRVLVPGTKTVVVGVLTFEHSGHDYHRTMKSKLYALEAKLKEIAGEEIVSADHQHIFCDSAPFLERRWAQKAGLGFIGKNHAFIHPQLGSLVHLGELCLQSSIHHSIIQRSGSIHHCFNSSCPPACRLCIDACPRGVLGKPTWDVHQCIAYETNECLICQNSCPYNEKSQ